MQKKFLILSAMAMMAFFLAGFVCGLGWQNTCWRLQDKFLRISADSFYLPTDPRDDFMALEKAIELEKQGDFVQSKAILSLLYQNSWVAPEALEILGNIAWKQGEKEIAMGHWTELQRRFPQTQPAQRIAKNRTK